VTSRLEKETEELRKALQDILSIAQDAHATDRLGDIVGVVRGTMDSLSAEGVISTQAGSK